jgi:hypothetical protein
MPVKMKTKKRNQTAGVSKCRVSSKIKGMDLTIYNRAALQRVLEDNKFLKAKNQGDQNDFMKKIIPNIISRATKGKNSGKSPYIKPTIICLKCLNHSKLHQVIYDNTSIEYKKKNEETGKNEEVPASDDEIKVRLTGIANFINLVLVPSLREYKEQNEKSSKTEEVLGKEFSRILGKIVTIEDSTFDDNEGAAKSLAEEIFNNKDKLEEFYEEELTKKIEIQSCNPNDEEDRERCSSQGKKPEFFLYLVTGLFAFALAFEFA